jgi:hypothetical protein
VDDLQQAELQEREACLRRALEAILMEAEQQGIRPSGRTVELLEAAGYEFTPAA